LPTPKDPKSNGKRRRAAFRHAVFTQGPIRLTAGYLSRVRPGRNFSINHRTILLPDLADELCGLKITHLSDPHIGELVTPAHLPHIIEAANKLGGDLIAVTGDFIDFSNAYLPAVVDAMKSLEAPLGAWFVLGNHDYLDNADEVKKAFADAGLNLLLNEAIRLPHRGKTIGLGGIDWADEPQAIDRMVNGTARLMKPADLSILLAHHPHAFDSSCRCGIDLTLSGHTHGGQVLLPAGMGNSVGLAHLAFRYTRGLYSRGGHRLFVSSGVGSWFPFRFRCPAEITLLELQSMY
jgi:predicted MPP superfamily phosphohydrolase